MKALVIQREADYYDRTGKFGVATQWGHLGNEVWLYEGEVVTREQLENRYYDEGLFIYEAELTVKDDDN